MPNQNSIWSLPLAMAVLGACSPGPSAPRAITTALPQNPAVPERPTAPPVPTQGGRDAADARWIETTAAGIRFSGVAFDSRRHRLVVEDQAAGPGSRFADAESAGRNRGALAAVNGGFFTPGGAPLGLVVSNGRQAGSWNRSSSLGGGIWYDDGSPAITGRQHMSRVAAAAKRELIQSGPMLVEDGQPVTGLEGTKSSARTMLLWDGGTHWWIGRSSPCTLASLSIVLAGSGPASWPVACALNLDGGRSSELWISERISGGPLHQRPPWNRPVRNFLLLVER